MKVTLPRVDDHPWAVADNPGVRINESIVVERPAAEIYQFWRRLEHLPRFLTHVDRVTEGDKGHSRWAVEGPAGIAVEWDVEIVDELKDKRITWRSVPGSCVVTAGSVLFRRRQRLRHARRRDVAVRAARGPERIAHRVALRSSSLLDASG